MAETAIGTSRAGKVYPDGKYAFGYSLEDTNEDKLDSDVALGFNKEKLKKEINNLRKQIKEKEKQIDAILKFYKEHDGDKAHYFLNKPVADYDNYDKQLATLNPELYSISKKIDTTRQQINDLKRQEINLVEAQKQMYEPLDNAEDLINKSADEQLRSIATQKDIQVGAAQGLAGKAGASTGILANINSEISNKYAPQSLQVQAQRDSGIANIEGQKSNIPGKLSALAAQNITNQFNKEKITGQQLSNSYTRNKLQSSGTSGTSSNLYKFLLDYYKSHKKESDQTNKENETENKDTNEKYGNVSW